MRVRLRSWVSVSVCVLLGALSLWSASALASGGGFALPDGRGWELVSPVDKHGAAIEGITLDYAQAQAAEDGGGFAYTVNGAIAGDAAGNGSPLLSQALSRRASGGWSSQDIAAPHEAVVEPFEGTRTEYKLFSPDLSVGLVEPKGDTPLPPLGAGAEKTIYLRDDATGSYLPLVTAANVPPGSRLGDEASGEAVQFRGASPDLSHVVFWSPEALTADAVKGDNTHRSLYEWAGGQLQLVSVLPDGKPAVEEGDAAMLGFENRIVRHAVSDDGSRVVWETFSPGGVYHLYLRDVARGETVQVDVVQEGAAGGDGYPVFQAASGDGSRVFFTDGQRLTTDSQATGAARELYVFESSVVGGRLSGTLKDLTVAVNAGEGAGVQGMLSGVSEDGSDVYFVANGVLASGAISGNCEGPESGKTCDLYVLHRDGGGWGKPKFVAVLSSEDLPDWGQSELGFPQHVTSRVSPDGRFLVFMSDRSLTGYDNRDAVSGVPDEEVYRYDDVTGRVVCVSCAPSGARPVGIFDAERVGSLSPLVDQNRTWLKRWLAGNVPGWTPVEFTTALYQSRYLSDGGRVFFQSPVALVPGDVNGREDVYEYEPAGMGGCQSTTGSLSVVFSVAAGGCVGLVSSGVSGDESAFLDASASGGDVFFLSSARLSPLDVDGAFDVYDAHECTGSSPCPAPVVSSPACGSAESCRGSLPAPAAFAAPGSATFTGAGNAPPVASGPVVGRRVLSRAQKLAQALRVCRGKPRGKRRVCEARARRAYRATQSKAGRVLSVRAGR